MKQTANSYQSKLEAERENGTRFGMRTEFRGDCRLIISLIKSWLLSWKESSGYTADDSHVDDEGRYWSSQNWSMDTDIEFILKKNGPTLNELQWLINAIVDCHVPAQTVALLDKYTGERINHEVLDEIATPPRDEILKAAIESVKKQQDSIEMQLEIYQTTIERFRAQLGDEEPYKLRVAKRNAEFWLENFAENKSSVDPVKLAEFFFQKMTFDKAGAHITFSI